MRFKVVALLAVLCTTVFLWGAEKQLIVGMELSYPPFETLDKTGNPYGIGVDLAKAMGEYMGREIQIQNIPFIGLIPSLKSGKIDVILSSMSVTKEREKAISFSQPYLTTGLCLLLSKNAVGDTLEQLNKEGNTIVVKLGTTGEVYARANIGNAKVRSLEKEAMCILEVIQGKADAFIYDQFSVLKAWQQHLGTTKANLVPFAREDWALGVRKEETALLEQMNAFLKAFRERGGFQELANKYLPKQQELFKDQGIPFVFDVDATHK